MKARQSSRRNFIQRMLTVPMASALPVIPAMAHSNTHNNRIASLKLSLNAYSFNKQLLDGSMTIDDLLEFAAKIGLMAVDLTGYYFRGYPKAPSDEVIYKTKRKAFSLGLEICGTGVRNDFTHADAEKRRESIQLVKDWIDVSQKLGGQTVRIFSGTQNPQGYTRAQIFDWMVNDIRECVDYAASRGIVLALQNHNDFLKTAEDTIQIMEAIKSPWYGLMLDIGSYRTADPYDEIARTIQYAVTWQIKEKVYVSGKETDVNVDKLVRLIKSSGFRGYLPLEALGAGDPRQKVTALLNKFERALTQT